MNTLRMNPLTMRALLKQAAHREIQRALDRWAAVSAIDARLAETVLAQFEDERAALAWLCSPHPDLAGQSPLRVAAQPGGLTRVMILLACLAGVPDEAARLAS